MKLNVNPLPVWEPLILSFDCETRPLSYTGWGNTDEITSIACSWYGSDNVEFYHLPHGIDTDARYEAASRSMLLAFTEMYDKADMVSGHYVINFDLPKINGALIDNGLPPLGPKLVSDTKNHLIKFNGISKSQENLGLHLSKFNSGEYLGRKEHVAQAQWRPVNRLTRDGIRDNKRRVVGDVLQHKQLRAALLASGMLKPPKIWRP